MPVDKPPSGAYSAHTSHADLMDNTDLAELGKAVRLIGEGRKIKRKVQNRLRMRAARAKDRL